MRILTDKIHPNEPCHGLKEAPKLCQMPDGSSQWRWVQQVWVVRDDTIACFETDFGPEENFEMVTPMAIFSMGDDSVAECQDAADRNRVDFHWQKRNQEMLANSTLMRDIVEQREKIHQIIRNRTVSGPYGTNQRNGYSHITSERNLMQKKRERSGRTQF